MEGPRRRRATDRAACPDEREGSALRILILFGFSSWVSKLVSEAHSGFPEPQKPFLDPFGQGGSRTRKVTDRSSPREASPPPPPRPEETISEETLTKKVTYISGTTPWTRLVTKLVFVEGPSRTRKVTRPVLRERLLRPLRRAPRRWWGGQEATTTRCVPPASAVWGPSSSPHPTPQVTASIRGGTQPLTLTLTLPSPFAAGLD